MFASKVVIVKRVATIPQKIPSSPKLVSSNLGVVVAYIK
jgi:hypothetical protein